MELLQLEVSAAFLHPHSSKKERESHGLRHIKIAFLSDAQTLMFSLMATQTKAMPAEKFYV